MSTEMKLTRNTGFLGRNGNFTCSGFVFTHIQTEVWINPITSKGYTGRCRIEIPKEDITEFCRHLQQDLVSLVLQNIPPDCLPVLLGLNDQLDALIAKELGK